MCRDHGEFGAAVIYSKLLLTPIDLSYVGTDQAKAECYNRLVDALSEMDETDQAKDNYKRALKFNWKSWDLNMFTLQALTTVLVIHSVSFAKQIEQKTSMSLH